MPCKNCDDLNLKLAQITNGTMQLVKKMSHLKAQTKITLESLSNSL